MPETNLIRRGSETSLATRQLRPLNRVKRDCKNLLVTSVPGHSPGHCTVHEPAAPGSHREEAADREAVYEELQPLIRRLLYQFGKTPELRQDLSGELYYRFCRLMADYDPSRGIPLSPYLVHMLQQHAYNYVRTFWRDESRSSSLEVEESNGNIPAADESSNCLKRLITEELLDALPAVIAKLPHRQRLVVVWRYYEYRSFDEIAEMLTIQPATARSLLRHGLEAMRRQLRASGFLDR